MPRIPHTEASRDAEHQEHGPTASHSARAKAVRFGSEDDVYSTYVYDDDPYPAPYSVAGPSNAGSVYNYATSISRSRERSRQRDADYIRQEQNPFQADDELEPGLRRIASMPLSRESAPQPFITRSDPTRRTIQLTQSTKATVSVNKRPRPSQARDREDYVSVWKWNPSRRATLNSDHDVRRQSTLARGRVSTPRSRTERHRDSSPRLYDHRERFERRQSVAQDATRPGREASPPSESSDEPQLKARRLSSSAQEPGKDGHGFIDAEAQEIKRMDREIKELRNERPKLQALRAAEARATVKPGRTDADDVPIGEGSATEKPGEEASGAGGSSPGVLEPGNSTPTLLPPTYFSGRPGSAAKPGQRTYFGEEGEPLRKYVSASPIRIEPSPAGSRDAEADDWSAFSSGDDVSQNSDEMYSVFADSDSDFEMDFTLKPSIAALEKGLSESETGETADSRSIPGVPWFHSSSTSYKIIHSQYMKQTTPSQREDVSGTLSVLLPDTGLQEKPLYKWVHCEHTEMSFDAFIESARSLKTIDEDERTAVVEVLEAVRNQHSKSLEPRNDTTGQYLAPHCIRGNDALKQKPGLRKGQGLLSLCVPYFSIEKYQPVKPSGKSMFYPMRPLLQSWFASAKKSQDMQQAVCQMSESKDDRCFHVGQVWCLVVNSNLLLTCARVSVEELIGSSINLKIKPPAEKSNGRDDDAAHVRVFEEKAQLLWLLPRERCKTYLELTGLFRNMQTGLEREELDLRLFRNRRKMEPAQWEPLMHRLKGSECSLNLRIVKSTKTDDDADKYSSDAESDSVSESESLQADGLTSAQEGVSYANSRAPEAISTASDSGLRKDQLESSAYTPRADHPRRPTRLSSSRSTRGNRQRFYLFEWIKSTSATKDVVSSQAMPAPSVPSPSLVDLCEKAEESLLTHNDDKRLRNAYGKTVPRSVQELSRDGAQRDREFLRAVRAWLTFYLPSRTETTLVTKIWGAVYQIIEQVSSRAGSWKLEGFIQAFVRESVEFRQHRKRLAFGRPGLVSEEAVEDFTKSFICTTAALILASTVRFRKTEINLYFRRSKTFLHRGLDKFMTDVNVTQFTDYEAVLPLGVATLVVSRLLGDLTGEKSDIAETYWNYFKILELKVENEPFIRAHQGKLSMLKQEINAVLFNLNQQKQVVAQVKLTAEISRAESQDVRTTYAPGENWSAQDGLVDSCLRRLDGRVKGFEELLHRISGLQDWNLAQIESNNDRHNNAVYAFTIVTIVFLPLSFVTSFLGMNTNDIRNMGGGQWIFWAAGIPLTALVICAALLWAGELENLINWARNVVLGRERGGFMSSSAVNWQVLGKQDQSVRRFQRSHEVSSVVGYPERPPEYGRSLQRSRTRL